MIHFRPYAILLALMLSGVGNDLLDYLSVDSYWSNHGVQASAQNMLSEIKAVSTSDISSLIQDLGNDQLSIRDAASVRIARLGPAILPQLQAALHSPDPEVSNRAEALIARLVPAAKDANVRRLMAIRTLGELHAKEALPELRKLTEGKQDLFIADYARTAIAEIEDKPLSPAAPATDPASSPDHRLAMSDVWMLPAHCDVVLQYNRRADDRASLNLLRVLALGPMPQFPAGGAAADQLREQLLGILNRIGNVRVDSLTIGLDSNAPGLPGIGIFILRGEYDSKGVRDALRDAQIPVHSVNHCDVFQPDSSEAIIPVSDDRMILFLGEANADLPIDLLTAAAGRTTDNLKGALNGNAAMSKLIAGIDTTSALWLTCTISDGLKQIFPSLGSFDSITLAARKTTSGPAEADKESHAIAFEVRAASGNANAMREGAAKIDEHLKLLKANLDTQLTAPPNNPARQSLQKISELLQGLKINVNGANGTLDCTVPTLYAAPFLGRLIGSFPPNFTAMFPSLTPNPSNGDDLGGLTN